MKKVFTLIEILIVIIIIWIIIWALGLLSWGYIHRLKFRLDMEKFKTLYIKMYANTLGFFEYSWNYYKTWWIQICKNSGDVLSFVLSWYNKLIFKKVIFDNSKIKKILINGVDVSSGIILFRSNKISTWFKTNSFLYKTWWLQIVFSSNWLTWSVKLNLDVGKMY